MNQIWLRTVVVDPQSRVLYRLPQEPLPPNLRVSQLRSYLEQRFGPPLAEHVAGEAWMEFDNPTPTDETRGSRLLAVPLIHDPRTGELVPVFEKLEQFADLAAALGTARPGAKPPTAAQIWVGPLFNHRHLKYAVHDLAARAARGWLMARGLHAEIGVLRSVPSKARIPAPGLDDLLSAIESVASSASGASDMAETYARKLSVLTDELAQSGNPETLDHIRGEEQRLGMQHNEAVRWANRTERRTRDLAQLALGISACLESNLQVERLDRVCTAIIRPPSGTGRPTPLHQDGLTLHARSERDLVVELAGVICRLLLDRDTLACLSIGDLRDQAVYLQIESGDTLLVTARAPLPKTRRALLKSSDWREEEPELLTQRWRSPVSAIQPARVIAKALFGPFKLGSMDRLNVSVASEKAVMAQPESEVEPERPDSVM